MKYVIFFLSLIISFDSAAATVKPIVQHEHLGIKISGVKYPKSLNEELMSGLTTQLIINIELIQNNTRYKSLSEINIKYDLWDEVFHYRQSVNGTISRNEKLNHRDEVTLLLSEIAVQPTIKLEQLDPHSTAKIKINLYLNPVERERIEKIRKWVAKNNVPSKGTSLNGHSGLSNNKNSQRNSASSMFLEIFNQYTRGENIASEWKKELESEHFSIGELGYE